MHNMKLYSVVILAMLVTSWDGSSAEESPTDELFNERLFEVMGKHSDIFVESLVKVAPEYGPYLHSIVHKIQAEPDQSLRCTGCQILLSVLAYLVKMGYTMDELAPPVVLACNAVMRVITGQLQPGTKLCKPTIDNYAPHVERILRYNRLLPEESCYFLNHCTTPEESFEMPPVGDIFGPIQPPPARGVLNHGKQLPASKLPAGEVLRSQLTKQHLPHRFNRDTRRQRNWQGDDNILRVAQFTDIHVDELYEEGAPTKCGLPVCCRKMGPLYEPSEGSARQYGEYNCNIPPSTTRLFLGKAQELNPHIVLYSGDSPPHHLWEETLEWQMQVTTNVAAELTNYFSSVPTYSAIGNHECFPSNMYYPKHNHTQVLHETFIAAYGSLGNFQPEQLATIRHAGYYTSLVKTGLRILAFNTNFGYTANWNNLLHIHQDEYYIMMEWAEQVLAAAAAANEKVIIISHHPCGDNLRGFDEEMTALMVKYSNIIILNVVGHTHTDEFRLFRDNAGNAKGLQFISQSANPLLYVNPGVRMYYFDDTTYTLLGYEQYYLDIQDQIDPVQVKLLYKTDDEYDLDVITPNTMLEFAERMQSDDALFQKFCKNYRTGAPMRIDCNKKQMLCRQVTSTVTQYRHCLTGEVPDPEPTQSSSPAMVHSSLFSIALTLIWTLVV